MLSSMPTDAAKRKAIDSLPPTLEGTYERILERVNESDQSVQALVQKTLRWVIHGNYIEIEALCEAVSSESDLLHCTPKRRHLSSFITAIVAALFSQSGTTQYLSYLY